MSTAATKTPDDTSCIRVLPAHVIEAIKAGEVVHRPAAAIKELVENSLDAGSTEIIVAVSHDCLRQLSVHDNGCGMSRGDLGMAAQRHATSKLKTVDDLSALHTFGFRGEALASLIQAAQKLHIISRKQSSAVAFQSTYKNEATMTTKTDPTPCARKPGTTITLHDLFWNWPQRQKMRAADEYQAILQTLQHYAILYAGVGVSFVCQRMPSAMRTKSAAVVDLNTSTLVKSLKRQQLKTEIIPVPEQGALKMGECFLSAEGQEVTKRVIALIYGSHLLPSLLPFQSELVKGTNRKISNDHKATTSLMTDLMGATCLVETTQETNNLESEIPSYTAWGFITAPSLQEKNSSNKQRPSMTSVFFVNQRLVDCPEIKKLFEEIYRDYNAPGRHFVFLSLTVPTHHVDVNVHPSKRQVALLFLDEICQHLVTNVRELFSRQKQAFVCTPVGMSQTPQQLQQLRLVKSQLSAQKKPYHSDDEKDGNSRSDDVTDEKKNDNGTNSLKRLLPTEKKRKPLSQKRVRIDHATPAGALEPFLIMTQPFSDASETPIASPDGIQHDLGCPLAVTFDSSQSSTDLSQPGAFAELAAQCRCHSLISDVSSDAERTRVRLPRQAILRPKKVIVTNCSYTSIAHLRQRISKQEATQQQDKVRNACFVGVVSHQRSLIQCGEELILMNHYECGMELFYQIALCRFGEGTNVARFGSAVDVAAVVAAELQGTDSQAGRDWGDGMTARDTNVLLAEQTAMCLMEHAEMLKEYFGIVLQNSERGSADGCAESTEKISDRVMLTGLPILLDGYEPSPHGLPLFLLRLATEVDWTDEKPCFHGICRELGAYYAQLPPDEMDWVPFVRHTLFPAISTLLIPSDRLVEDEAILTLTSLTRLYRVFERC